ncbi:PREDICTED: 28S ribosomal protein S10, mitochondrial [Rhagoletis zephyria]|uniref:28S ribosomal protein S10, mitochondrial n=1 Tax=Rhagoletis zephyria TaxID=28612 RepID=UPI0008113D36|nr:PREDICTED: 28S ribosomal protein S10, mitochondrial [Rhagoletis zephyria]
MISAVRNLLTQRVSAGLPLLRLTTALYSTDVAATTGEGLATIAPASINEIAAEKDKLFSKLEIELRGIDPAVLKSYAWFATTAANHLNIEVGKCWAERKAHHDRLTLLKSVHIYKKHRVQYEVRTYFRYLNFHKLTGSTLDTFLEYIERNLPEGVALNATKTEIQEMPEHLRQPPSEVQS